MRIINKIINIAKEIIKEEKLIVKIEKLQLKQNTKFIKALWKSCPSLELAKMIKIADYGYYKMYLKDFFKIDHEKCWKEYLKFGKFYKQFEDYGRYHDHYNPPIWKCVNNSVSHSVVLNDKTFNILKRFCKCTLPSDNIYTPRKILNNLKYNLKEMYKEVNISNSHLTKVINEMKDYELKILEKVS